MSARSVDPTAPQPIGERKRAASDVPANNSPGLARVPDGIEVAAGRDGAAGCLSTLIALLSDCVAGIFSCLHSIGVVLGLISDEEAPLAEPARVPRRPLKESTPADLPELQRFIEQWISSPSGAWTRETGGQILREFCALADDIQEAVRDAIYRQYTDEMDAKIKELTLSAIAHANEGRAVDPTCLAVLHMLGQRSSDFFDPAIDLFIEANPLPEGAITALKREVCRLKTQAAILTID